MHWKEMILEWTVSCSYMFSISIGWLVDSSLEPRPALYSPPPPLYSVRVIECYKSGDCLHENEARERHGKGASAEPLLAWYLCYLGYHMQYSYICIAACAGVYCN